MNETLFRNSNVKFLAAITSLTQLDKWLESQKDVTGFAMVGRSNVGKSSLINSLFGKKTARVSNTPGRTQSINIFSFQLTPDTQPIFLYDLPGYGHAKVSKQMRQHWNDLLGCFFENLPGNVLLLNIQDARHPFQAVDQDFLNWLTHFPLVSCFLCLNKFDKLKKQKDRSALGKVIKSKLSQFPQYQQIYKVSAEHLTGLPKLHEDLVKFLLPFSTEATEPINIAEII